MQGKKEDSRPGGLQQDCRPLGCTFWGDAGAQPPGSIYINHAVKDVPGDVLLGSPSYELLTIHSTSCFHFSDTDKRNEYKDSLDLSFAPSCNWVPPCSFRPHGYSGDHSQIQEGVLDQITRRMRKEQNSF